MSRKRNRESNDEWATKSASDRQVEATSGRFAQYVTDGDKIEAGKASRKRKHFDCGASREYHSNAQSRELRTYLAGQVGRALRYSMWTKSWFLMTEVCLELKLLAAGDPSFPRTNFASRMPTVLEEKLFPMHPDLKYAGLLNPIDAPHHMRANEDRPYREGIIVDAKSNNGKGSLSTSVPGNTYKLINA